jgi:hypothetical protein
MASILLGNAKRKSARQAKRKSNDIRQPQNRRMKQHPAQNADYDDHHIQRDADIRNFHKRVVDFEYNIPKFSHGLPACGPHATAQISP